MRYDRLIAAIGCALAVAAAAQADMIVLEGVDAATVTTGDLLDGTSILPATVAVAEIAGLQLTARSGGLDQVVNTTTSSLGINLDAGTDDTDAFDVGEILFLSFSKPVRINQVDFNGFDAGESFALTADGLPISITYDDLANKSSDVYDLSLELAAGTELSFAAGAGSVIGLDGIDITVIPEPATAGLLALGGIGLLAARRMKF